MSLQPISLSGFFQPAQAKLFTTDIWLFIEGWGDRGRGRQGEWETILKLQFLQFEFLKHIVATYLNY